jgi:hypothetical protein
MRKVREVLRLRHIPRGITPRRSAALYLLLLQQTTICGLPWSCQRRAMLIAARNSQDIACCPRATASARSKYASAFAASGSQQCD